MTQKKRRPPKPPTRFRVGDVVVPDTDDERWTGIVDSVAQEWIGDEWREYVGGTSAGIVFAGNADLFRPAYPSQRMSTDEKGATQK